MKKLLLMIMLMAPLATFAQKFGKVNSQTIFSSLPEVAKANGEFQALQQQKRNELESMQNEFQRQLDAYQKGKSTMNQTQQEQKETELSNLSQKIQQASQDAQQELEKKQQELMQPIQTKIMNAISSVGKTGGYTFIFEEGSAPYMGTTVEDVTSKVQAEITKMK